MAEQITEDTLFGESSCINSYLHRFNIKQAFAEGVVEICDICGQKEFFKIVNDRVDNINYLAYHARQALPPQNPLFIHEYPKQ